MNGLEAIISTTSYMRSEGRTFDLLERLQVKLIIRFTGGGRTGSNTVSSLHHHFTELQLLQQIILCYFPLVI